MKVLALDYGSARTGVAVSDPTGTLARPLGVVDQVRESDGFERLIEMIAHRGAGGDRGRPAADAARRARPAGAETAEFVEALRGAVECRWRRTTSGSPRCWPTATTHARPRTCSRAICEWRSEPLTSRRAVIRRRRHRRVTLRGARRRRRRGGRRLGRRAQTAHRGRAGDDRAAAAAEAVPHRLPRGLHARGHGRPRRRRRRDRAPQAQRERAPQPHRPTAPRARAASSRASAASAQTNLEGFLFPATYEFLKDTTSRQLVARPDRGVLPQLAQASTCATRARRT